MKIYDFNAHREHHREYCAGNIILSSKPIIENIELISCCNLKCRMCVEAPKRSKSFISLGEVKQIVEENYDLLKGEYIWLHHFGEPLLHPEIIEIISYLVSKGINPRLSTNATLLNREFSEKLVKSGLKEIVFSMDTLDKDKFEYYRVGANFDDVLKNILDFLKIKRELKSTTPITQIQCINIDLTDEEIAKYLDYWKRHDVNWINLKTPSTRANQVQCYKTKEMIKKKHGALADKESAHCFWLWSSLIILSNGDVALCCGDLKGINIVGNVFKEKLIDIWNGRRMQEMRLSHLNGSFDKTPLCKNCPEIVCYKSSFEDREKKELLRNEKKNEINLNHHRLIENAREL